MQTLQVKEKGPDGKPAYRDVRVLAIWGRADGAMLYLHQGGVYGYKDGSPVRSKDELADIIDDPKQRKVALNWWDRFGKDISAKHYAQRDEYLEKLASNQLTSAEGDIDDLDAALYQRRPKNNRSASAYSHPLGWAELFDKRPDWWGLAETLTIGEWYFKRVDGEIEQSADRDDDQQPSDDPGLNAAQAGG